MPSLSKSSFVHRTLDVGWHVIMTLFFLLFSIPAKIVGHLEREMERITLPQIFGIRKLVLRAYVAWIGARMMEEAAEPDLNKYRCMRDVFTRELKQGIRPIDKTAAIVSPCDNCRVIMHGRLTKVPEGQGTEQERDLARRSEETDERGEGFVVEEIFPSPDDKQAMEMGGKQKENRMVHVKGIPYRLQEILGVPPIQPDEGKKLEILVCHLAESELHHFSSPFNSFEVWYRIRIPGHVLPLLPERTRRWPYMLWSNERIVLVGTYLCGGERCFAAIAFLAATAFVGHIRLDAEPELKANQLWDALSLSVPYLTGWRPPFAHCRRTSRPYGLKRGSNCAVPVPGGGGEPGSTPWKGLHVKEYHPPMQLESGQRIGHFASGSGVFMIWEAPEAFRLKTEAMTIGHPFPLGSPLTDVKALTPIGNAAPSSSWSSSSASPSSASAGEEEGRGARSRRSSVQSSSGGTKSGVH